MSKWTNEYNNAFNYQMAKDITEISGKKWLQEHKRKKKNVLNV